MNPNCSLCLDQHPLSEPFSVREGTLIQQKHLNELKSVLKDDVFAELQRWAWATSADAQCGHEVTRGQDLWSELHRMAISGNRY